jgi:hypothetical protein
LLITNHDVWFNAMPKSWETGSEPKGKRSLDQVTPQKPGSRTADPFSKGASHRGQNSRYQLSSLRLIDPRDFYAGRRGVGQAAMRRDRRLPFGALERRHIGRGCSLRLRRSVVAGDLEPADGIPPIILQTIIFRGCEHALRLPRKRRAPSNWKISLRSLNVRVGAPPAIIGPSRGPTGRPRPPSRKREVIGLARFFCHRVVQAVPASSQAAAPVY